MVGFILDTKVFNAVVDGALDLSVFEGRTIYAAHVQFDELSNTPIVDRRQALLVAFKSIDAQDIATTSISRWAKASWGGGDLFHKLHDAICAADARSKKKVSPQNQLRDALLGETAIQKSLCLVTDDGGLRDAVISHGGMVVSLTEFQFG